MSRRPFAEIAADVLADPVSRVEIEKHKRAIRVALALAKVRTARGKTQREIAQLMHVSQARISRLEHGEDYYLSTLRDYVAALGGRLSRWPRLV